jgi:signal transduction histidine kinase
MRSWSLKWRLSLLAALGISIVLVLAGFGFSWLYRNHVERFVMTELNLHMDQLLGNVTLGTDGKLVVDATLSDPRFEQPGGGMYWQIDVAGQDSLRSRSLWDDTIVIPTPPDTTEEDHAHILVLPNGQEIFSLEKRVIVDGQGGVEKSAVVTVGLDRSRVTNPISEFLRAMLSGLAVTYALLLATMLALISVGLRPLRSVQRGIARLRTGEKIFDASGLPEEVTPLAEEVNALVAAGEHQLVQARQRASNLAHGLKTPLAVMQAIANELRLRKQTDAAQSIELNAGQMRDLVDRELTRSRMAQGVLVEKVRFVPVAERVLATMKKAPRGSSLSWQLHVPENLQVRMEAVDLMELLGNLLDNARKHARSTVRISHDGIFLIVEDDGAGVSDADLPMILRRGVRLDEKLPGSGIGLAIVSDLAEVYGLALNVRRSELGGLAVVVGMKQI